MSDDSICATDLFSSKWHCLIHSDDVIFICNYHRNKTNDIISKNVTGLNVFRMAFMQSNYCMQWNIIVDAVNSDQNVFESLRMIVLRICFEIVNMSQMPNVLGKCALKMTAIVKSSAQIERFQVFKNYQNFVYFILL